jgi:hypothetical protein
MRMHPRAAVLGLASITAVAGLLSASPAASLASAARKPHAPVCKSHDQPVALLGSSVLDDVGAVSTCDAWAVGSETTSGGTTNAIEHWNGKAWSLASSPDPLPPASSGYTAGNDYLDGIDVLSATDAWAVGDVTYAPEGVLASTDILHWNGKHWQAVASTDPGGPFQQNQLVAVSAASAKDIWAVGNYSTGGYQHTLTEHWNGKAWATVPSPGASGPYNADLYAVTATSPTNAWAGGSACAAGGVCTQLILHWNGKHWSAVKLPAVKGWPYGIIQGLSSYGGKHPGAWAVGSLQSLISDQELILHWNGHAWQLTALQKAPADSAFAGVDAFSATSAIAVGTDYLSGETGFIARWNGKHWVAHMARPFPGLTSSDFYGVGGSSCADAWAVGSAYDNSDAQQPQGLHC